MPSRRTAVAIGLGLLMAGCGSSGPAGEHSSALTRHAVTAGHVMTRVRGPIPARAAALSVTGRTADTTIVATKADGSTWGGTVTLRITVADDRGAFGSDEQHSACFTYRLAYPRTADWGQPHPVRCGSARPLDLASPPLPDGVTAATRRRIATALAHGRGAPPAAVRVMVQRAIGIDFYVTAGRDGSTVGVQVRYGDSCLFGDVTANGVAIGPVRSGDACFGG